MDDGAVAPARHKLTVDDFVRMSDAGIFGEDDRIELIDGGLVDMATIGLDHAATVNGLTHLLIIASGEDAIVSVQNPVFIDQVNMPQPDVALLRPRADNYRTEPGPAPADVLLLIIEVADSSLRLDRTVKLPLYSRAGIVELWIVDLERRCLDAYRDPADGGYASHQVFGPGDSITVAAVPEITIPLHRVFD